MYVGVQQKSSSLCVPIQKALLWRAGHVQALQLFCKLHVFGSRKLLSNLFGSRLAQYFMCCWNNCRCKLFMGRALLLCVFMRCLMAFLSTFLSFVVHCVGFVLHYYLLSVFDSFELLFYSYIIIWFDSLLLLLL